MNISLILFLAFTVSCQTLTNLKPKKEWSSQQAKTSESKEIIRRDIAQIQDEKSNSRPEPNYSKDELTRKNHGLKKVQDYCNSYGGHVEMKKDCFEISRFIDYIEPELFDLCETIRNEEEMFSCWNVISNKVYTQEEREQCKKSASRKWNLFSCLRENGIFIRPIVSLSEKDKTYCNKKYRETFRRAPTTWYENSFGIYPIGGNCDIFGCKTSNREKCNLWGCPPPGHQYCYVGGGISCRESRTLCTL